jgi:hypothetical protein
MKYIGFDLAAAFYLATPGDTFIVNDGILIDDNGPLSAEDQVIKYQKLIDYYLDIIKNYQKHQKKFYEDLNKFEKSNFSGQPPYGGLIEYNEHIEVTTGGLHGGYHWPNKDEDFLKIDFSKEIIERYGRSGHNSNLPKILSEKGLNRFLKIRIDKIEKLKRKQELIARSAQKKEVMENNYGFIYVLSNKIYEKNIYKIGSTYGLPEERAEQLSSTEMLYKYKVDYFIKIKDAEYYEKLVHKFLKDYRVEKNREFFQINLNQIKDCLKQVSKISDKGAEKITLSKLKKEIILKDDVN